MEIMGGLIKLDNPEILPIPWFMRPHLGLETGTEVWYATTQPKPGRLPDIIVSPLDPRHFPDITRVTLSDIEDVGTLADVIKHIRSPVNIALADSVTLEKRDTHRINLVLEQAEGSNDDEYRDRRNDFIRRFSDTPDEEYGLDHSTIYDGSLPVVYPRNVKVREGQIEIHGLIKRIGGSERYEDIVGDYDLTRLVVSSNPDQRLVRYIIPKKGVVTFRIPHEDKPGVLYKLVHGIAEHGYNILCSRLSRAPTRYGKCSIFVCECEPTYPASDPDALLADLEADEQIHSGTKHFGRRAKNVLYPCPPGSMNIRPNSDYVKGIAAQKEKLRGLKPLFVSRRFVETRKGDAGIRETYVKILEEIRQGAQLAGWVVVEAPPVNPDKLIDQEVFPLLWFSQALLVFAFFEDGSGKISHNQANELGFATGQNEPAAILVEEAKWQEVDLSNYSGRTMLTYSMDVALHSSDPASVRNKVRTWLERLAVGND